MSGFRSTPTSRLAAKIGCQIRGHVTRNIFQDGPDTPWVETCEYCDEELETESAEAFKARLERQAKARPPRSILAIEAEFLATTEY